MENIQRVGTVLASLAELFPEIVEYFDAAEAGKAILAASSLPPQVTRTEAEVQELREAKAQAAEGQALQEGALNASQAIKNVGGFLQEGGVQPTL